MKLADLKQLAHNPATRLLIIVTSVVLSVASGTAVTIWAARGAVDSAFFGFSARLDTLTTQAADLKATNSTLSDQARVLAGQVQTLSNAVEAETAARKAESIGMADKLQQQERSRRAEENGLLQQINGLVTRIDGLMDRVRSSSGSNGPRGDITVPVGGGGSGTPPG